MWYDYTPSQKIGNSRNGKKLVFRKFTVNLYQFRAGMIDIFRKITDCEFC